MMKKLLVLALVLGAMANAGLVTTVLETNKLEAVVDTTAKTISFIGYNPGGASVDGAITGLALNMVLDVSTSLAYTSKHASLTLTSEGFEIGAGDWVAFGGINTNGIVGTLVVFTYTGDPTKATLYSSDDWGNAEVGVRGEVSARSLDGKEIQIPEPMTMLLLGLGGLFIRRK